MTPHEIWRSIIVTARGLEDLSEVEHYVPELSEIEDSLQLVLDDIEGN